jgi:hypothetical protein
MYTYVCMCACVCLSRDSKLGVSVSGFRIQGLGFRSRERKLGFKG